ncbi:MAG: SRPBCC family protein [Solirubrobacterales bacterium]
MPRVTRSRLIPASTDEVWRLVSDPHSLPRWWPRMSRVEAVREVEGGRRSRWTKVLMTKSGRPVRADYRCTSSAAGERYVWEQDLENTPFERILTSNRLTIELSDEPAGTRVTLEAEQSMRGLSRLGGPMASRAARRTLTAALGAIEDAFVAPAREATADTGGSPR